MSAGTRQKAVLDYIVKHGEVTVQQLSQMYAVSDMTIRRDLVKLVGQGLIKRTYGGAIVLGESIETSVQVRATENLERKIAIAEVCAQLVQPKDTILMDAGTTVMEVARRLPEDIGLTVVTNAITVVNALIYKPGIEVLLLGGTLAHVPQATVGSGVIDSIKSLYVNRAFITATGFSLEHGLTDANIQQSEIKRCMMSRARIRSLVIDSSKYGVLSLHRFADLEEFDQLITDNQLDSEALARIQAKDIELCLAPTMRD
ncbi:HTH-type transcriptional repressor GlcR [Peptococcaceae bacterium CEB3]|nr:HTH-type transcriptional repressor GlcR [Peptococcaceae bacterium CEB3]